MLALGMASFAQDRHYDELARFLAGLPQREGSPLKPLEASPMWQTHQQAYDQIYAKVEAERLPPIRAFVQTELAQMNQTARTVFYPFSGPDFMHADLFFPQAQTFFLMGLERVGSLPKVEELSQNSLRTFLEALRVSTETLYQWGYLITSYMSRDFNRSMELRGVIPVIMVFMARGGYQVERVEKFTLDKDGNKIPSNPALDKDDPKDNYISGAYFEYRKPGEQQIRKLYYFSHDISNQKLAETHEFMKFMSKFDIDASYFKAAAYYCRWMTDIRNLALRESEYIFQSDCGIDYKHFKPEEWELTLYGKYENPISQFDYANQPDLKAAYQRPGVRPLGFGIDYGFRIDQTNLQLAHRKP